MFPFLFPLWNPYLYPSPQSMRETGCLKSHCPPKEMQRGRGAWLLACRAVTGNRTRVVWGYAPHPRGGIRKGIDYELLRNQILRYC